MIVGEGSQDQGRARSRRQWENKDQGRNGNTARRRC